MKILYLAAMHAALTYAWDPLDSECTDAKTCPQCNLSNADDYCSWSHLGEKDTIQTYTVTASETTADTVATTQFAINNLWRGRSEGTQSIIYQSNTDCYTATDAAYTKLDSLYQSFIDLGNGTKQFSSFEIV